MAWPRAVNEIRVAVRLFMSRLEDGELSAAGASGLGHNFVVPAGDDPGFSRDDALVGDLDLAASEVVMLDRQDPPAGGRGPAGSSRAGS